MRDKDERKQKKKLRIFINLKYFYDLILTTSSYRIWFRFRHKSQACGFKLTKPDNFLFDLIKLNLY